MKISVSLTLTAFVTVLCLFSACPEKTSQTETKAQVDLKKLPESTPTALLLEDLPETASAELLIKANSSKPNTGPQTTLAQLKKSSQIQYIQPEDLTERELLQVFPDEAARPVRMQIVQDKLYFLMCGQLRVMELSDLHQPQGVLRSMSLMPPRNKLPDGAPIREIVDLNLSEQRQLLFLLDKSNDIYSFDLNKQTWQFELKASNFTNQPDPHYIALESYADRLYLLDYARNQIWRKMPEVQFPTPYFSQDIPSWQLKKGGQNVTDAVDFYIDGEVYVLTRLGQIQIYSQGKPLNLKAVDLSIQTSPFANQKTHPPVFQSLRGDKHFLYALDAANTRIFQIPKKNPAQVRQLVFLAAYPEWGRMHDLQINDGKLWILAGNRLLSYPAQGTFTPEAPIKPIQIQAATVLAKSDLPDDKRLQGFISPVPGALLPDNAGIFPGARRIYRHGIHEGADFFDRFNPQQGGKYIRYGSDVVAIQAGVVKRADHGFQEMSPQLYQQVLAQCQTAHETSRKNEDKFRGRQIWIEHPGGVVSVYAHLSAVSPAIQVGIPIKQGEKLGSVGNSGTSGSIQGNRSNPHLHLEIWLHDIDDPVKGEYLGKWLSLAETRALWEQVFKEK
ncbi:MAG: M23 family metallopeptidase [Candidatus Sericytochromatia bacterium]